MNDESGKTLESMSQATWYNRWTKDQFNKYLKGQILEVGCGIGNFSAYLANHGDLTAIDVNNDYIQEAGKRLGNKARVGLGDIEEGKYFFKEKKFDVIVCMNVLEHINEDLLALKNIYKLLDDNGFLVLLVPAHKFLYNRIDESIGHYRRYQKEKLKQIIESVGLEIIKIRSLNFLGGLGWFIAGKLFKDQHVSENKIKLFNIISPIFLTMETFFEPPFGTSILVIARKKK